MRKMAKFQSKLFEVAKSDKAITLTLETVLFLILVLVIIGGIWAIVVKYVVGKDDDETYGFLETTKELLGGLFG